MKLYVFSSGALTIGKNVLQNLGPTDNIQIPVGFFVVMHPKGNVLFDTGNNDKLITDPSYWGPAFMGRLKRLSGRPLYDGVTSVCQRLHLSQGRSTAIGKLSRGYRQRVAIAQALLNNSPLW